jgi:N-acetyl-gamma-glutamyl-phosphate reductase
MSRGILATCTAVSTAAAHQLREALHHAYGPEPFVHLLPEGRWPATGAIFGSNAAHLQVAADSHAGRAIVVCALDNLVKGAAGQAIQIANLMLGLPETAGLTAYGVAP